MVQFRPNALKQQQKPDDLDLLMKVTKARGWVALTVAALALGAFLLWGIFGQLPSEVNGEGLLTYTDGVTQIQTTVAGQISEVKIKSGQTLAVGDDVATVTSADGKSHPIKAQYSGVVMEVLIDGGNVVDFGQTLYLQQRSDGKNADLLAFVFVSFKDSTFLAKGMPVDLTIESVSSSVFGVLRGEVSAVESTRLSRGGLITLLGDEELAQEFLSQNKNVLVRVALTADASTTSGYQWSTVDGPPFALPPGARLSAAITESETRPINLILGR